MYSFYGESGSVVLYERRGFVEPGILLLLLTVYVGCHTPKSIKQQPMLVLTLRGSAVTLLPFSHLSSQY